MRRPELLDVVTVVEDVSNKVFDSPWTPKVLIVMTTGAGGFLLGVESVRAACGC